MLHLPKSLQLVTAFLLTVVLSSCQIGQNAGIPPFPPGTYEIRVQTERFDSNCCITLREDDSFVLEFIDPASPLFGLREEISTDTYRSGFMGIEFAAHFFTNSTYLMRRAIDLLHHNVTEHRELKSSNRVFEAASSTLSVTYIEIGKSREPLSLSIQDESQLIEIVFLRNLSES